MTTVTICYPFSTVVLEQVFPRQQFDVKASELPNWISEYGNLRCPITGDQYRLVGVRCDAHPHVVSYAACYWYVRPDHTWRRWCIRIGASGTHGLHMER
jgi:hypothetical protein